MCTSSSSEGASQAEVISSRRGRTYAAPQEVPKVVPEVVYQESGALPFAAVYQAVRLSMPEYNESEESRKKYLELLPEVRQRFRKAHGSIVDEAIIPPAGGVVLTDRCELHVTTPGDCVAIQKLVIEAEGIATKSNEHLSFRSKRTCNRSLFGCLSHLIGLNYAHRTGTKEIEPEDLEAVSAQIERARAYCLRAARRRATGFYLLGALLGVVGLAILVALLSVFAFPPVPQPDTFSPGLAMVIALAGGIGACISILMRVWPGQTYVDHEASTALVLIAGAARPVVGAVFGCVVYFLVFAGFLPVAVASGERALAGFLALGFLTGFSERVAKDTIMATSRTMLHPGTPISAGHQSEPPTTCAERDTRGTRTGRRAG